MDNYDLTSAYNKPQIADGISGLAYKIYAQKAAMSTRSLQSDHESLGTEQDILDARRKQRAAKHKAWNKEFKDNKRGKL